MIEQLMRKHLAGHAATSVLDIGPGYGDFSRVACQVTGARRITYVDLDPAVLSWQRAACERAGLACDAREIALAPDALAELDGPYDVVLCQEVLEHLSNAEQVFAAIAAHLAPRGRIIITVPTAFSERWLKLLNPAYMKDEPYGHVREFDAAGLRRLIGDAGLAVRVLVPTQPHYFLVHTWTAGTRMRIEGSTGRVLDQGWRAKVAERLGALGRAFFARTAPELWGRLLPRNYFVVAERA